MDRETYRDIIIGVNIIMAGIFLFSVIRSLFEGLSWLYPLLNLMIWMTTAVSSIIGLRRKK